MRRSRYILGPALVMLTIGAPRGGAHQQSQQPAPQQAAPQSQNQPSQPIPAYRSPLAGTDNGATDDANGGPEALAPDTRSLAGAQDLSVGAPKTGHSFWAPYFDVSSTLASNSLSGSGTGWTGWGAFFGGVDLQRTSGNSDLILTYLGGDGVSSNNGRNSILQQLGVGERLTFRRYSVTFLDQALYTPEAAFGYAGIGGANLFSTGGNIGLQSGFLPEQSIVTALGQRISNASIVEFNTFLTPRSTLTFVAAYGTLIFFDNSLNNNYQATFQAGYNYLLTRKDSIALLYRFSALRYDHIAQSINNNSLLVSYARRVTGRLAFQIFAGPDIVFSQTPIPGSLGTSGGTVGTPGTNRTEQYFWHVTANVDYRLRRTTFEASYNHGVVGGSGVLAGAVSDRVSFLATRQLTPTLHGTLLGGYSRNRGLTIIPGSILATSNQVYDYGFANVSFARSLLRSMNLSVGYQANYQNSNSSFCVTATCGTTFLQHQVFLALGWHPRPTAF